MDNEIQNEEIIEMEAEVIEKRIPKGAIIAGVAGAAVAVGAGIKWLIGKLRDTNPDYVFAEDDDDFDEEIEEIEVKISEEEE